MSVNRITKRKKTKRDTPKTSFTRSKMVDPIKELSSIMEDANEIIEGAEQRSNDLKSFLKKATALGTPDKIVETIEGITTAIDGEVKTIKREKNKFSKLEARYNNKDVTKDEKFDIESEAVSISTDIMQAAFNIGTIMNDLEASRKKILTNMPEEGTKNG